MERGFRPVAYFTDADWTQHTAGLSEAVHLQRGAQVGQGGRSITDEHGLRQDVAQRCGTNTPADEEFADESPVVHSVENDGDAGRQCRGKRRNLT
jgi:hypothetical protein